MHVRRFAAGPDLVGALTGGLTSLYNTVEIRTSVTPPAVIDLAALAQNSGPPSPITKFLRPTIILSGNAGRQVIAPYGEAEGGWGPSLTALGVVVGIGFGLGWYARGRRR